VAEVEQSYCDWCYSTLTDEDRRRSRVLGFDQIQTWACARCIDTNRIAEPPDGWEGLWPAEPELEQALEDALNAWQNYSASPDPKSLADRFGRAVRLATERGRWDVVEVLSRFGVRIVDASTGAVEMQKLPGSPFGVIDLGFGPGEAGRGGRVREPRRPSSGTGSASQSLPE
jgi:hypothetical protein